MSEDIMNISKKQMKEHFITVLCEALKEKGITYEMFAEIIDVSPRMISEYVNYSSDKMPSLERMALISRVLSVSLDSLVF